MSDCWHEHAVASSVQQVKTGPINLEDIEGFHFSCIKIYNIPFEKIKRLVVNKESNLHH